MAKARRDAKPKASPKRDARKGKAPVSVKVRKNASAQVLAALKAQAGVDDAGPIDYGPPTDMPERPASVQHPTDQYSIAVICEAIKQSAGIVALASQKLKCSRKTIYRYAERYWEINAAMDEARDNIVDLAQGGLFSLIEQKNLGAICFALKTIGKNHGYSERHEVSGPNGAPVAVDVNVAHVRASLARKFDRIAAAQRENAMAR